MKRLILMGTFFILATGVLFVYGCADDDDDDTPMANIEYEFLSTTGIIEDNTTGLLILQVNLSVEETNGIGVQLEEEIIEVESMGESFVTFTHKCPTIELLYNLPNCYLAGYQSANNGSHAQNPITFEGLSITATLTGTDDNGNPIEVVAVFTS